MTWLSALPHVIRFTYTKTVTAERAEDTLDCCNGTSAYRDGEPGKTKIFLAVLIKLMHLRYLTYLTIYSQLMD